MQRASILLADDHALILEGLRSLLAAEFEVTGVATNGLDLVSEAKRLKPDIVLTDLSMPVLNGLEAARQIRSVSPNTKILFITQRTERVYMRMAFEIGASAYLIKQSIAHDVIPAIRSVLAGRSYVTPQFTTEAPEPLGSLPWTNPEKLFESDITPRQRQVIQLVADGKSNKEIANILNVSIKTVNFHKTNLMNRLNLRSTAELTRYAIKHGIVDC